VALPTLRLEAAIRQADEAKAQNPLRNRIIVYAQLKLGGPNAEETRGLFSIDPDSSAWSKISDLEGLVRVSPDGTKAAYAKYGPPERNNNQTREGTWIVDLGAEAPARKLADATGPLCWSADGKRLIISEWNLQPGDEGPMKQTSWQVNADGSDLTKLPIPETDQVNDWSRDGQWLATTSDRDPPHGRGYQLYVMHPDGTASRRLTNGHGLNVYPRFSPDSAQLAYFRRAKGTPDRIEIVSIDGSSPRTLIAGEGLETPDEVAWSPDGKRLVVSMLTWKLNAEGQKTISDPYDANLRLLVIDSDGKNARPLTLPSTGWLGAPQWI
jgi:Tol biopolymer transport system component